MCICIYIYIGIHKYIYIYIQVRSCRTFTINRIYWDLQNYQCYGATLLL